MTKKRPPFFTKQEWHILTGTLGEWIHHNEFIVMPEHKTAFEKARKYLHERWPKKYRGKK